MTDRQETRVPSGYRLVRPLGQGTFGTVHLAVQEATDRPVVLKILREELAHDPATLEGLILEAKVTSSLTHPHIVVVLDHAVDPHFPWIVFEYLAGGTVQALLDRGPLPFEQACLITAQIASALDAGHQVGVIHRDVKPTNILMGDPDVYKLTDFGIARWTRGGEIAPEVAVLGTPGYMAPELALGGTPNVASDVYSLGVTFHELVVGRRPFQGSNLSEILEAQHHETPRLEIPGLDPGDLGAVIRRALSPDPERRHATIGELYADLAAALGDLEKPLAGLLPVRLVPLAPARPPRASTSRRVAAMRETEKIELPPASMSPIGDLGVEVPFEPGSRPQPGVGPVWIVCVGAILLLVVCLGVLLT